MKMMISTAAALASLAFLGLAAYASPQGAGDDRVAGARTSPRQCFFLSQVNGFSPAGEDRIYVNVAVRDVYEFETFGPCPDLDFSSAIALVPRGGFSRICNGFDVDLIVRAPPLAARRCPVRMIRKLSPEEARAARNGP